MKISKVTVKRTPKLIELKKYVIILIFASASCSKTNSFENILSKDSERKFWVEKEVSLNGRLVYNNSQWVFHPNGTAELYFSSNERIKGTPAIISVEGDGLYHWNYNAVNKSFQKCSNCFYKVSKFNTDTIWITSRINNQKVLLIKK